MAAMKPKFSQIHSLNITFGGQIMSNRHVRRSSPRVWKKIAAEGT